MNTLSSTALEQRFPSRPRMLVSTGVIEVVYVVLLLFAFVGFDILASRDPISVSGGAANLNGGGDVFRQLCYIVTFGILAVAAIERRGFGIFSIVPLSLLALLVWCAASSIWAPDMNVAFRRAVLAAIVVFSTMASIELLGATRAIRLWRNLFILILIANWISIFVLTSAIHQANELDQSLVGDWRGLFFQKNIAGAWAALAALLFFHYALEEGRKIDWIYCVASVGFLIGTGSKSSIAMLPLALLCGLAYRWGLASGRNRALLTSIGALLAVSIALAASLNAGALTDIFSDPASFTGRAEIWRAELDYISHHPLLGAGFGSFADTGARSPLYPYIHNTWLTAVAHGHNGYLQTLVTIGLIGFALTMLSLILMPGISFFRKDSVPAGSKALFFSIFVFTILHNFLESDFLEGGGVAWVAFLMVLALLRTSKADAGHCRAP